MPSHLEALNGRFSSEGQRVMPHVLAIDLGLTAAHGLAVIDILHSDGVAEVVLVVYHNCEPDLPAGYLPFGNGFPDLPWHCPICEEDVKDIAELRFDIECRTPQELSFY
jgi:hypothetical protein